MLRAYIYNHLIVRGTAANISECISSGKLEAVLYDLYERGIKNGMISVGDDQYCVFSPKINVKIIKTAVNIVHLCGKYDTILKIIFLGRKPE